METVKIHTDYITLGQLLKFINVASSGGDIKTILQDKHITVNGEEERRRGKKLYPGMKVEIESIGLFLISK
ncbi:MAG: S4 domain-containing protein YaaA [Bacillota bacterium]